MSKLSIEEMIELYKNGSSTSEIAKLSGFKTAKSVGDKLKKAGVTLRTSKEAHALNKGYSDEMFQTLDAEWKAYFLGLLLTDGWITSRIANTTDYEIVGYSSTDKDVVEFISSCTGKNIQIVESHEKVNPQGGKHMTKNEYRIILNSKQIATDLARLGVVPNKSLILQGPNLNKNEYRYLSSIMKGIIDGDGTLGVWEKQPERIYFRIASASESFIDWCIWALEVLGMRNLNKRQIDTHFWEVNSGRKENIRILSQCIYSQPIGMMRKYNKIHNHFNKYIKNYCADAK